MREQPPPAKRVLNFMDSNRPAVPAGVVILIVSIAAIDWRVIPNIALGLLYLFPILIASTVWSRWRILVLAIVCSVLREVFGGLHWQEGFETRLVLAALGFTGAGWFVSELTRNRALAIAHLDELRRHTQIRLDMEEHLRALIETTPLAILAVDGDGYVLLANESAHRLLGFEQDSLKGRNIRSYLPVLDMEPAEHASYHTELECHGKRVNGESFLARVWLSTYRTSQGRAAAACVWDASEQLRDREDASLDAMMRASSLVISAVSHEIRNLAAAASAAHDNLKAVPRVQDSQDYHALGTLVTGLHKLASDSLRRGLVQPRGSTDLGAVLEDAHILLQPLLAEIGADLEWKVPSRLPLVRGEPHGILQAILNVGRNSCRALEASAVRCLSVEVTLPGGALQLSISDTGPGVARPENLFRAFQIGAEDTGLGLYVSRALLRSYGGDLRFVRQAGGARFMIELARAGDLHDTAVAD